MRMTMRMILAIRLATKLDAVAHSIKLNRVVVVPQVRHTMRDSYQAVYHPREEIILLAIQRQDR
jgi:hypothetical protein